VPTHFFKAYGKLDYIIIRYIFNRYYDNYNFKTLIILKPITKQNFFSFYISYRESIGIFYQHALFKR